MGGAAEPARDPGRAPGIGGAADSERRTASAGAEADDAAEGAGPAEPRRKSGRAPGTGGTDESERRDGSAGAGVRPVSGTAGGVVGRAGAPGGVSGGIGRSRLVVSWAVSAGAFGRRGGGVGPWFERGGTAVPGVVVPSLSDRASRPAAGGASGKRAEARGGGGLSGAASRAEVARKLGKGGGVSDESDGAPSASESEPRPDEGPAPDRGRRSDDRPSSARPPRGAAGSPSDSPPPRDIESSPTPTLRRGDETLSDPLVPGAGELPSPPRRSQGDQAPSATPP